MAVMMTTGSVGSIRLDVLLNLHAGLAGQHEIQQDDVVKVVLDLLEAFFACRCRVRGQTFGREQEFDAFSDFLLIVDDENDSLSFRHSLAS